MWDNMTADGSWELTPLPDYGAGFESVADDGELNADLYMVGAAQDGSGNHIPQLWHFEMGVGITRAPLPLLQGGLNGHAMAVANNTCCPWIVGYSEMAGGATHAVYWELEDDAWKVFDMPPPQGYMNGMALGVASHPPRVVGVSDDGPGTEVATYWMEEASGEINPCVLPDIINGVFPFFPVSATDIDPLGRVVGYGPLANGGATASAGVDPDHAFILLPDPQTGVVEAPAAKGIIEVQAYPNPFNSTVRIDITLDRPDVVRVDIYDASGRRVKQLANNRLRDAGSLVWDGRDDRGGRVATGVYFARVEAFGSTATKKVVLAR